MTRSKPPVATFFVANPGHHTAMVQPVVRHLSASGRSCRVLSLCEVRGLAPPVGAFDLARVELTSVVPFQFRKPGTQRSGGRSGAAKRVVRAGLRRLAWSLLRRRITACVGGDTVVAVLPNDAAYPYRGIAKLLRERRVPFVLLQEGVRFKLPGGGEEDAYGQGGATAVAAWGESSAEFFRAQGARADSIHLTGNPRFDGLDLAEWSRRGEQLRRERELEQRPVLLYLSNPIEHMGLVASTDEKLALFRTFCTAAQAAFERTRLQVLVKLHGSEPAHDFQRVLDDFPNAAIRIVDDVPLYTLLAAADAAVVLASTAGMEALLFDVPLGVVALPNVGYAFDYVQQGAALGLGAPSEMAANIARLLAGDGPPRDARDHYLARMVAVRSGAAERVADLVERCARAGA